MKKIFERRASAILYRIFINQQRQGRWLIPANVCPVVPAILIKSKVPFEFVDINPSTLLMNAEEVLHKISGHTDKYAGVLWVDTYGFKNNPETLFKKIKSLDAEIFTFHDKCLAPPEIEPKLCSYTDAMVFSTGYGKYLDIGFGGYAWLQDYVEYSIDKIEFKKQDLEKLEVFLKSTQHEAVTQGFEICKSNWIESDLPDVQLEDHLQTIQNDLILTDDHKNIINNIYTTKLPVSVQLPAPYQRWRFNITIPKKDVLLKSVFEEELFASSHYAPLNDFFGHDEKAPASECLHDNIVNLFNDKYFSEKQACLITDVINRHIEKYAC